MSLHEQERRRAFERQALAHLDALYNLALWMTGDPVDAEDLVQEAFLKALRFAHQFQEGTNLKAWLLKIVKNSYINRYRKGRRESLTPLFEGWEGGEPARGLEATGELIQGDEELGALRSVVRSDIDKALAKLPEEFRIPIILSDLEGLSMGEIADVLSCPRGTVKSRIFRGRRLLKELLKDYGR
jgi:RNA polymerase sigma-70 factor (ECF subfamily)